MSYKMSSQDHYREEWLEDDLDSTHVQVLHWTQTQFMSLVGVAAIHVWMCFPASSSRMRATRAVSSAALMTAAIYSHRQAWVAHFFHKDLLCWAEKHNVDYRDKYGAWSSSQPWGKF